MLRSLRALLGYTVCATDGNIGSVHDFYFDDDNWFIRYLVVDTGHWLPGRKVLVPPGVLGQLNWTASTFPLALTRKQVEKSPDIDTDKPVSRQQQLDLHNHFGWPAYWIDPGFGPTPGMEPDARILESATPSDTGTEEKGDPHLRSVKEVRGYPIHASDGKIGHAEDFVADVEFWVMRSLVVDTRNWLPGKLVLIAHSGCWKSGSASEEWMSASRAKTFAAAPSSTLRHWLTASTKRDSTIILFARSN